MSLKIDPKNVEVTFTMTLHDLRIMTASCAQGAKRLSTPEAQRDALRIAQDLAEFTGKQK